MAGNQPTNQALNDLNCELAARAAAAAEALFSTSPWNTGDNPADMCLPSYPLRPDKKLTNSSYPLPLDKSYKFLD